MNIYITTSNAEKLNNLPKGQSKSGLINKLLDTHFKGPLNTIVDKVKDIIDDESPIDEQAMANAVANMKNDSDKFTPPAPLEKPCCLKKNPCQHWQWNEADQLWQNSLSGRTRENEL